MTDQVFNPSVLSKDALENTELLNFANELKRQQESKKDFHVNTGGQDVKMTYPVMQTDIPNQFMVGDKGIFDVNDFAHSQIASKLKIPATYYNKMRKEYPTLLADNVNSWFNKNPKTYLVRILDDTVRAFVSNRYVTRDNWDLVDQSVMPVLMDTNLEIKQLALTDTKLYMKLVFPDVSAEIKKDDVVQAGIVISNSEVGAGAVKVESLIWRLVCSNGMIGQVALRKHHVGRHIDITDYDSDTNTQYYSANTLRADDKAFFLKVKDMVKASINPDIFNETVDKMREATEDSIPYNRVDNVVDVTKNKFSLRDAESKGVLAQLLSNREYSRYGLANAITGVAHDKELVPSYDRQIELEKIGGKVIDLTPKNWYDQLLKQTIH